MMATLFKIEVEDGSSVQRTWHLHRAPLLEQSTEFRNWLGNGDDTIFLENTSAETVETFSQWLYTKSLNIAELRFGSPFDLTYHLDLLPDYDSTGDAEDEDYEEHDTTDDEEDSDSDYPSDDDSGDVGSPSPIDSAGISPEDDEDSSVVSDDSETLAASSPPPVPDQSESDVAAFFPHPVDRVIVRLLDLYTFAQQYAIPRLQTDALTLLQNFREDHRAERHHLGCGVIRRACESNGDNETDPLWSWLAEDFAKSSLESPADVDAMCRELPPSFWRSAFKAKMEYDASWINIAERRMDSERDTNEYLKDQLEAGAEARGNLEGIVEAQAEKIRNLQSQVDVQAETLGEFETRHLADDAEMVALQLKGVTAEEEIQRLETRCQNIVEARDIIQDLLEGKDAELARLRDGRDLNAEQCLTLESDLRAAVSERDASQSQLEAQAAELARLEAQAKARDALPGVLLDKDADEICAIVRERDDAQDRLKQLAVLIQAKRDADAETTLYRQAQAVSAAIARERLASLADARQAEVETLQSRAAADAERIAALQGKLRAARDARDGLQVQVEWTEKSANRIAQAASGEIDELKARLASSVQQRGQLQSWLDNRTEELGQLQVQYATDAREKGELVAQVRSQARQINSLASLASEYTGTVQGLETQMVDGGEIPCNESPLVSEEE
ncbi:hypothetical protein PG993_011933 [Apiospora rasikravindrae]|uniref:BTB domain-containing protein n=1 Tax=Apiospora rasikravindrae TaxID=990691 RepID=A0ABR1S101_9PEZI